MADRIIVLGWAGQAIELLDVGDATALVDSGCLRVSLTRWSGQLADATVLMLSDGYLASHGGPSEEGYTACWLGIRKLVRVDARRDFTFDHLPALPTGGA